MSEWSEKRCREVQKDWPLVRKLMWMLKMPTPVFVDKKEEEEFYRSMAKKYGIPWVEGSKNE